MLLNLFFCKPQPIFSDLVRSVVCGVLGGVLCISAITGTRARAAELNDSTHPNIVMFMPDDLDRTTVQTAIQAGLMPNLVKYIINQGTTFNNYYVVDARGCPVRMGYLNGQYYHNMVPNSSSHQCSAGALTGVPRFNDTSTLGTWLQAGGYQTSFIGKYIDGYGYTDVNGDGAVTLADSTYIPPGWNNWEVFSYAFPLMDNQVAPTNILPNDNPNEYEYFVNINGRLIYHGYRAQDYQQDVLTSMAVNYMANISTSKPFYMVLAPGAPHIETNYTQTPQLSGYELGWSWDVRPAPRYAGTVNIPLAEPLNFNQPDVSDMPQWVQEKALLSASPDITDVTMQWNDRLATLRDTDEMIGRVVQAMIANGTYANSVLFFTSDNGWFYGNHRLTSKLAAYEESIGVPFYASIGGGVSSNAMIISNDWAPSIAQLAGVSTPSTVDGTSFVPLLSDPTQPWRHRYLAEHWEALSGDDAVFDMPDYLALRISENSPLNPNELYVQYETQELELYNCTVDPYEINNLAVTSPSSVQSQLTSAQGFIQLMETCKGQACHNLEFQ